MKFHEDLPAKKKLNTSGFASLKRSVVVAEKEEILKADTNIFARLTVIAQTHELEMPNVLQYELGPIPWSVTATEETVAKTAKDCGRFRKSPTHGARSRISCLGF